MAEKRNKIDTGFTRAVNQNGNITWDDSRMNTLYANAINIVFSREEVALFFGVSSKPDPDKNRVGIDLKERIIINPFTAKKLVSLLEKLIHAHESAHGSIELDSSVPGPPVPESLPSGFSGSVLMETPIDKCRLLIQSINALNIKFCYEKSVKFLENKMLVNRFLLSINKNAITQNSRETILDICRKLNMPGNLLKTFDESLSKSDIVHFGFEEDDDQCLYKIYLEPLPGLMEKSKPEPDLPEAYLFYLGFKWDDTDKNKQAMAVYNHYPVLSQQKILERISAIYNIHDNYDNWIPYEIARDILDIASKRTGQDGILYVEVTEENNPRRSFDINIYEAKLRLKDLSLVLSKICQHYSIPPERFTDICDKAGDDIFGHITGGIDRSGKDFFTIYFGVEYIKSIDIC